MSCACKGADACAFEVRYFVRGCIDDAANLRCVGHSLGGRATAEQAVALVEQFGEQLQTSAMSVSFEGDGERRIGRVSGLRGDAVAIIRIVRVEARAVASSEV